MSFLNDLLQSITERGRSLTDFGAIAQKATPVDQIAALSTRLLSAVGEASGLATAAEILSRYDALDRSGKGAFFERLLHEFGPDVERLRHTARDFAETGDWYTANRIHAESEPGRQKLFRRLNQTSGGTVALIRMRSDLLRAMSDNPDLKIVDRDFRHLFGSWFNRGFLELRKIDWQTSAAILEKIIKYEAVHEITDWDDLRSRIDPPDRLLYAFFHPRIHDEPLIFVEVALMQELPPDISSVLNPQRDVLQPDKAKAAIFYSISDCQPGLRGISFGNFLIKQVIEELRRELPFVDQLATLSPVRGLDDWLKEMTGRVSQQADSKLARALVKIEELAVDEWWSDEATSAELKSVLMPLAAHYFVTARNERGTALDPVTRFHLGNGARLERINWLADTSEAGLNSAYGIMVNYLYKLDEIEKNHERFVTDGTINASTSVKKLARADLRPIESTPDQELGEAS